jgi:gamma-glutamylaminecyclotransferase
MCVIIVKQNKNKMPIDVAKTSSKINPHGLGVIWLDTYEVSHHTSKEYKVLDTDRPFIAHFRYATIGAVGLDNTHPFRCGKNKAEWLMMNGTIHGLGNEKRCDSRVLAEQIGSKPRQTWKEVLEQYDSRFVTINTRNRTFQMYNKDMWHKKDGIWYSKDNVLQDNLVAVYGTLKKGNSNYYAHLTDSKFVGKGETKDKYPLIIKGLPYLIEDIGVGHNVDVDIFKVTDSTLARLDALEGHPHWYQRKLVPIKTAKGNELMCWVYFNLDEEVNGQKMHKAFSPLPASLKRFDNNYWGSKFRKPYELPYDYSSIPLTKEEEQYEEIQEYNIEEETPMCVECYNDLKFDGFANYHCGGCGSWFTETEVVRFRP